MDNRKAGREQTALEDPTEKTPSIREWIEMSYINLFQMFNRGKSNVHPPIVLMLPRGVAVQWRTGSLL